ncbi:MAG: hypothetical protein V7636_1807 [Actinomycetota bacterium]
MNQIQVLGSHNSYHVGMSKEVFDLVHAFSASSADALDYHHPSLATQLTREGARQLEIDVYADPKGGLFSDRHIFKALGKPLASGIKALDTPGFKVQHEAEIDFETSCVTFVLCLQQVKSWSDDHPKHLPVQILVEAKSDPSPDPAKLGFVTPVPIGAPELDALDVEIHSVFDDDALVRPSDVTADGWPTLEESRGKVWFALDNEDLAPVYRGTTIFTSKPDATAPGFAKLNDPVKDAVKIRELVKKGFIVRTRADADTVQARTNDTSMRDAALASGAQLVSTDYLTADTRLSSYRVQLPGGAVARCDPLVAPPECKDDQLSE